MFKYESKTICFKNWIKSGITHVKDLFDKNEKFKTLQELFFDLKQKSNWMCEYKILKTAIYKKSLRFNMTCCAYIQNIGNSYFNFVNGAYCIEDKK